MSDLAPRGTIKKIIWIGSDVPLARYPDYDSGYQPFYHIDLFLTLGGKYHDPLTKQTKELVFLAEVTENSCLNCPSLSDDELCEEAACYRREINDHLNLIVQDLDTSIFKIQRLPLVIQNLSYFSYNNCFVEIYKGKPKTSTDCSSLEKTD